MSKPPAKRSENSPTEADPLADELARQIGPLVSGGQKAQVIARVLSVVQEEMFSGPIAHPKHLREYEEICPGAADRIISMAEKSLNHSCDLQADALQADVNDTKQGRLYGFLALASLIAAALVCALYDKDTIAGLFLGAGALGVIGSFIKGKTGNNSSS